MAKKKLNKQLLNEELNRFKMMSEYAFYEERAGEEEAEDLILGDELKEDEEEGLDSEEVLGGEEEGGEEAPAEPEAEEEPAEEEDEEPLDLSIGDDEEGEALPDDMGPEADMEPAGDEIELDVTELVNSSEEAKASADAANSKIEQLMGMVAKLEGKLSSMDAIGQKIDNLEAEVEKRVPTENEKLELRSLDSAPFKMRLGDYWKDKEGQYDVMGTEDKEPKEYKLTQDDVDNYSDADIKNSFDNEYTEDEI